MFALYQFYATALARTWMDIFTVCYTPYFAASLTPLHSFATVSERCANWRTQPLKATCGGRSNGWKVRPLG